MSIDTLFVKMHTGDPGSGGAANAATNATRKALSCADLVDDSGRLVQDAVVAYTGGEVTATETYAWVSYWTAASGGDWLGNEDITNQAATVSVALNIAVGTILVTAQKAIEWGARTKILAARSDGNSTGSTFMRSLRRWRRSRNSAAYRMQQAKFALQPQQKIYT